MRSAIERLISAYRKDDWADPEAFVVQLGAVLEEYPVAIVEQVTNPKTGIQRTCRFPPSIAEVVAACNEAMAVEQERIEAARRWEEAERQIELRRQFYADRIERPNDSATHAGLCRKYQVRDIPAGLDAVDVARLAARHGAGLQAYFDSLNAPPSIEVHRQKIRKMLDRCAAEARRQEATE